VVASMGGAPTAPNWYGNLLADPSAEIQVKAERIKVAATTADEAEKPRLWKIVADQWPNYDVYQSRTERVIPVVVLSPAS
jgi:deazaflavin-dependent oxidoreductase (nitroreductase family)